MERKAVLVSLIKPSFQSHYNSPPTLYSPSWIFDHSHLEKQGLFAQCIITLLSWWATFNCLDFNFNMKHWGSDIRSLYSWIYYWAHEHNSTTERCYVGVRQCKYNIIEIRQAKRSNTPKPHTPNSYSLLLLHLWFCSRIHLDYQRIWY